MKPAEIKRYELFEKHGDTRYHSAHLPLPNVVRIEVLSPEARARYLGAFHGMAETFRNGIIEMMSGEDGIAPFYGFFDPKTNGDLGFDVNASWSNAEHTGLDSVTSILQNFGPTSGVANVINKSKNILNKGLDMMGIDNESTGSNTMKTFRNADFQFNKTIKCSWYMPEMENMARVSISRLIKLAFVKNFDTSKLKGQYASQLADLLKRSYDAMKNLQSQYNLNETDFKNGDEQPTETEAPETPPEAAAAEEPGFLGRAWDSATNYIKNTAKESYHFWVEGQGRQWINSGAEAGASALGYAFDKAVNVGLIANEFFGGSLTLNPLPIRLTLGHQIDIEPLVITGLKISGSQEQFMTTDGSNIPLFVNAEISVAMWMVPDPNKGAVRYLGDNLFNMAYTNARKDKDVGLQKKAASPRRTTPITHQSSKVG